MKSSSLHAKRSISVRRIEPIADVEVGQRRALCELVPRTDELAVVAAVDTVAHQRSQVFRDRPRMLDRQVRNAAARIELIRTGDRARRADVDAACAGTATLDRGRVDGERQVREDLAEEEHRARILRQQQACACRASRYRPCAPVRLRAPAPNRSRRGSRSGRLHPRCAWPAIAGVRAGPCDSRGRAHTATPRPRPVRAAGAVRARPSQVAWSRAGSPCAR